MNKYALRRSLLTVTISSALASGMAQAATITVDTANDGPIGMTDGCSLREAIASANDGNSQGGCSAGSMDADSIVFDPSLAASTITLNQSAALAITSSLSIIGPVSDDPTGLVIDGDNQSRIFEINGPSNDARINVEMEQLTLTRGRVTGIYGIGGAIESRNANLTLDHALITGNSMQVGTQDSSFAGAYGAGLGVYYGDISVISSQITNNSITATASGESASTVASGSAMWVVGGSVSLIDSDISGNTLLAQSDAPTSLSRSNGSVVVARGELMVLNSSVSNNTVQALANGDVANATGYAGGLLIFESTTTITGSLVTGNSVSSQITSRGMVIPGSFSSGGGLFVRGSAVQLTNSTISGNSISSQITRGGGIFLYGDGYGQAARLTAIYSTIAFNTASSGNDGIYLVPGGNSNLILARSLVVQGGAGETACNAPAEKYGDSLVTDASCTGTATPGSDIALGGLADNGGPTLTHGLLPGSVAIDSVNPCDGTVVTDQRGLPRPATAGTNCDIGAFELQPGDDLDTVFSDRFEQ